MPELSTAARVAAVKILAERVAKEYAAARKQAETAFLVLRTEAGVKSLDVVLPSGDSVGTVSILSGTRTVTWDAAALLAYVERAAPTEIVETVDPTALDEDDVRELIAAHRPDLVRRTVRDAYRAALDKTMSTDGTITDDATGEVVRLATVTTAPPTGAFSYRKSRDAEQAVLDAWHAGELAGVGTSLVPELDPAPGPALAAVADVADHTPQGPFPEPEVAGDTPRPARVARRGPFPDGPFPPAA